MSPHRPLQDREHCGSVLGAIDTPEAQFWAFVEQGELRVQRCLECARWLIPPSFCCPDCLARHLEWTEVEGRGTVWSFTVYHHSFAAHLDDQIPYNAALVELVEGPLLIGNVVTRDGVPALEGDLRVGLAVDVVTGRRDGEPFYWFVADDPTSAALPGDQT